MYTNDEKEYSDYATYEEAKAAFLSRMRSHFQELDGLVGSLNFTPKPELKQSASIWKRLSDYVKKKTMNFYI